MRYMRYILLFLTMGLVGTDQLFKFLAVTYIPRDQSISVIGDLLHLTYLPNTGAAFGAFSQSTFWLTIFTGLVLLVAIILLFMKQIESKWLSISIVLLISGGIGNFIDRVFNGYVTDYIYVKIINFAVFNFADCCVVLGTAGIFIYLLFLSSFKKKKHG